jgi:hypothetical protein
MQDRFHMAVPAGDTRKVSQDVHVKVSGNEGHNVGQAIASSCCCERS